jgi:NADPH:quinone reductase-like Zn-dependent oxidoreductase
MAPASAERQWNPRVNPWVIAGTVALAAFMEVLDTSVANVALPHISGNLGVSTDDGTWVLTSYLVSNAIVLPMGAWASSVIGRKRFLIGKGEYMKIRQLVDDAFDRWGAGKGSILDLVRAVDRTGLKPIIDRHYAFDDLQEALDHLQAGAFGKIAIDVTH